MQDFIQYILWYLSNLGNIWYLIFLLIVIWESIILLWYFLPGTTIAIIFWAMWWYDIWDVLFIAILWNIIGNFISYFIWRKVWKKALKKWFLLRRNHYIQKASVFFNKNWWKSIFFGKCIPGIKENISFIAWVFKMDIYKYILWNIIGAIIWAILFVGLWYMFSSSLNLAYIWAGRLWYIMAIILLLILFLIFLRIYIIKFWSYIINHFIDLFLYLLNKINIHNIVKYKNNKLLEIIFNRFNKNNFSWLPLTILVIIIFYLIAWFDWIIELTFDNSIMKNLDVSIENSLYLFRNNILINIFLFVTYFWNPIFIIISLFFTSLFLYLNNNKIIIIWLLSGVGITSLVVEVTKLLLQRPRPELSIYYEFSYSFPSFHSSISIVFYSFIIWIFFRKIKLWNIRVNLILLSFFIALSIWFSRLYLDVHYFSDILWWYIIWLIGLFFWITITEFLENKKYIINKVSNIKNKKYIYIIITTYFIITLFYYNYYINNIYFNYNKKEIKIIYLDYIKDFFTKNTKLKYTSTITWRKTEPINFIFLVKKDQDLLKIFNKSWFTPADKISLDSIKKMWTSLYDNIAYNDAPMLPLYWNTNVQKFWFQKVNNPKDIRFRHHIRIWKTNFKYKWYSIFVWCWVYDNWLKWHITHKISPNIDKEREYIFKELNKTWLILENKKIQLVKWFIWNNFSWDQFFTDGKTYILKIK